MSYHTFDKIPYTWYDSSMHLRRLLPIVTAIVMMFFLLANSHAAPEGQRRVVQVTLQGNQVVSATTVLGKVQTQEGQTFSPLILNEDIKRLYGTGFFDDVQAHVRDISGGVQVIFTVVEKPLYSYIQWEGARKFKINKLDKLMGLQPGEFLDERRLNDGLQAIRDAYEGKGYPNVMIEHTTRTDPATDEATVYVLIDEGERIKIKHIDVAGNQAVSSRKIRKAMKTKRRRWVVRSGKYERDVLEEDERRVAALYRIHGYQDAHVDIDTVLDAKGKHMRVAIDVDEGPQYMVTTVQLVGNVLFPEAEMRKILALEDGEPYNPAGLQDDIRALQGFYFDRGYIFADITPETSTDARAHRVTVTYRIRENEIGHIERIDIRGNLKTKDVVVRRELRLKPGEPFLGTKLRRSRERLMNLGYFEEVDFDTEPGSSPTHKDLVVNVKEQKTGQFSFGGGFSSVDRLLGFVELEQRNFDWRNWPTFTGAGQRMLARAEIGSVRQNYLLSFTEPWWFGKPVSFGFDLFNRTIEQNRSLGFGFDQENRGAAVRFGHEFTEHIRGSTTYRLERVEITDVPTEASPALKAEAGTNTISSWGTTIAYDTRDNRFEPTRGMVLSLAGDLAGGALGGDKDFYRIVGALSYYLQHLEYFVLEFRSRTGVVNAYGDSSEVPIFERFFGSGTNLIRGFKERRIGPLDPSSNDPIGGETMWVTNVDWVFPIAKSIKGSLFFDVGNVWQEIDDYGEAFEAGVGIGVRVKTPIGPLRLDLGFPLTKVKDEKQKPRFHFNISRGF